MGDYRIKDIEILTGIKAHTLRIWEKRYGIPSPARTETKIRNYSDDDLVELLNVAILNKNGVKISRIAEMNTAEKTKKVGDLRITDGDDIYHENLLLALMQLDEHLFLSTIDHLFELFGVEKTFSVHLANFLQRIGILWITGAIQPGQEHFITHLIRQKLISITDSLPLPDKSSPKVLLFLPESEWHELSLLFYHFILRNKGIYSMYLGQSMPYQAVIDSVHQLSPVALLTSCIGAVGDNFCVDYFKKMKKESGGLPIFAGGAQIMLKEKELTEWVFPISKLEDLDKLDELIG
jgi:DNA-binding transcriptional MerR regulator